MTNFLIGKFIKDPDNTSSPDTRKQYGALSSICGIICNIALFTIKFIIGMISNSIAVLSDAFNNLSDCASCLITLFGCRMAAKPADKLHPFGHGRMEFLTSLSISGMILIMGFELLKDSIHKIIHPEKVVFGGLMAMLIIFSICVKLWMFRFNSKMGQRINSGILSATAKDSLNDSIATAAALVSVLIAPHTSIPIDGIAGSAVSLFIMKSGYEIIRETVDDILGKPADPELVNAIKKIIERHDMIIGSHDLILHNYGPTKILGSCHLEFRSSESFIDAHKIVDRVEREIAEELNVSMTIHMDPVDEENDRSDDIKKALSALLKEIDEQITFHDVHIYEDDEHLHIEADICVPYELKISDSDLKDRIASRFSNNDKECCTLITVDRE